MPLKLSEVKPILAMLTDRDGQPLSKKQMEKIFAYAREHDMFAAEAAYKMGVVDYSRLQVELSNQSALRAQAAAEDIETIARSGMQEKPVGLTTHWGNRVIYEESAGLTLPDGAIAAANIAQNIVMIANNHPELADELAPAVQAASVLTKALASVPQAYRLTKERVSELWQEAIEGLRLAVERSGEIPRDSKGVDVNLDDYIEQRRAEVQQPHAQLIDKLNDASTARPTANPALGAVVDNRFIF